MIYYYNENMDEMKSENIEKPGRSLPPAQAYLLLGILIGYPLLSAALNLVGSTDPKEIVSKIEQIYLPVMLIQMITLLLIILVLNKTNSRISEIGFEKSDVNKSNSISGLIFFLGAGISMAFLRNAIIHSGLLPDKDISHILPSTIPEGIVWLLISLGAAFSEEFCFRGYVITRIRILTGNEWVGAVLGAAAFSTGHMYQGAAGVALTFVYGLLFAGLFIVRRSVYPGILAHFLQDAIAIAYIFIRK